VELVIFDALDANRLKRSQSHVQSDLRGLDFVLTDALKDFRSEVKSGSGRGDRPTLLRINSLIALSITEGIRPGDVGRERDVADAIEHGEELVDASIINGSTDGLKADAAFSELAAGQDLSLQFVALAEKQTLANSDLAAWANQAFPIVGIFGYLPGQQDLNAAVEKIAGRGIARTDRLCPRSFAAAVEPCRKNASVVEDHNIPGT
jgi:hypothetical protein